MSSRRPSPRLFWCVAHSAVIALGVTASATAASPPRVISWVSKHPAKVQANPPLASACQASNLRARLFLQGATGSLVGGVDLRNVGPTPCALVGWPTISFSGAAAVTTRWQAKKLASSPAPPDVLADPPGSLRALKPGKSAMVSLFWSNWCGPGTDPTGASGTPPDAIELALASGTSITVPVGKAPRCDAGQDPSIVSVGPFTPTVRHLPQSSRLPLHVSIVGPRPIQLKPGLRAFRVHRGELLHYIVALTNTGSSTFRFAYSSCPSYIEALTPSSPQAFVLNCRPADAIAPRATVLFAMQIEILETARLGTWSLTWQLAPKTYEAPFAPAAIRIVP
jgi:hypothetical protein